jgi:WhiB family transcriptional regulator, redox-sensing transcriptional regulator
MNWRDWAECRKFDPEMWFPVSDEDTPKGRADRAVAKTICASCPVRRECLAFALDTAQVDGVWGGKSESERRAMIRASKEERVIDMELAPG